MKPRELAEAVGVTIPTLLSWARQGRYGCPAPRRYGCRVVRFGRAEALAWLAARTQTGEGSNRVS